jgi:SAM-dependent methyltransferase
MEITADMFDKIMKKDGYYLVPDNIKLAIEHCIKSNNESDITKEYIRILNEFQYYEDKDCPINIKYNGSLTLDAYTAYYIWRNLFIPVIAFHDLSYHSSFQKIPSSLNILDIGSGTGAITLGLLSIFSSDLLSRLSLKITAIDNCSAALQRQREIAEYSGFDINKIKYKVTDINNFAACKEIIKKDAPYDYIFIANCLTEIQSEVSISLVKYLPDLLTDNGAIIIAEAQRNYTKKLIRKLIWAIKEEGITPYYPCNLDKCPYTGNYCWVWRYHKYKIPDLKINGQMLMGDPKDELVAIWLIITKTGVSLYDAFNINYPELLWGPVSNVPSSNCIRSICYNNQQINFNDSRSLPVYRRGHVVGLSGEREVIKHYII